MSSISHFIAGNNGGSSVPQQGGLYSVKTASIHFNHNANVLPVQRYHQADSLEVYEVQRRQFNSPAATGHANSTFQQGSLLQPHSQPQPQPKNNSLKKLKKDLALKKHASQNFTTTINPSLLSSSSLIPGEEPLSSAKKDLVYEYLTRNEVQLNPANVIASVV